MSELTSSNLNWQNATFLLICSPLVNQTEHFWYILISSICTLFQSSHVKADRLNQRSYCCAWLSPWVWVTCRLTDWLTDWMNECDQSKQTSDAWLRQKQREDTIPVFRPAADIRHACGAINKQWVRSRPPSPLFQLNCHRCVAPLPTITTKQTSSTPSASINKDTVFVRLCEGVWLVAIMALAPACVIAVTCGFSFFFFLILSAACTLLNNHWV